MPAARQKILLVARNFPPRQGGMERLIHHLYLELSAEFDLALVAPAGCEPFVPGARQVYGCALSPVPRFLWQCQIRSLRAARRFKPDLVVSGSGATAPAALLAAMRADAASVCYLHGLDLAVPSVIYRSVFLPAIRRFDLLVVNSRHTETLARAAGVAPERIRIVHPGVSVPDGDAGAGEFRAFAGIAARAPILLSVGRLVPRKGLVEFVGRILPRITASFPDLVLAIVGGEPEHALWHRQGERRRIERAAADSGVAQNVRLLGSVDDARLRQAYAASRLLVLPLRNVPGDVEGFGMVALEAASHGLPTVAFALGGVSDAVSPGSSGYLVAPGDEDAFARTVLAHLTGEDPNQWVTRCRDFAGEFAWPRFGERIRSVCRSLVRVPGQPA